MAHTHTTAQWCPMQFWLKCRSSRSAGLVLPYFGVIPRPSYTGVMAGHGCYSWHLRLTSNLRGWNTPLHLTIFCRMWGWLYNEKHLCNIPSTDFAHCQSWQLGRPQLVPLRSCLWPSASATTLNRNPIRIAANISQRTRWGEKVVVILGGYSCKPCCKRRSGFSFFGHAAMCGQEWNAVKKPTWP